MNLTQRPRVVCLDGATLYSANDPRWAGFAGICDFEVYDRTAPSQVIERAAQADMLLTNKVSIGADTIAALPQLRYIGVLATGYNVVDTIAARQAGITVTNIPAYSTRSVAQTAIALLLAITNRVEYYAEQNRHGRWSEAADFSYRDHDWTELDGKLFGVVGFGNTGQATAAIAASLGMRIGVFTSKDESSLPEGYAKMELDRMFAECDVLSLHCPLTESTRSLVDERRLAMMKPSAILINTSRGPVVDEHALANALNSSRIYAAGLDVLSQEPPESTNPLLSARNCFITPHIAWASEEARQRLLEIAIANAEAFINGKPQNVV
ncbi:MAG: D-2-hydroxyacid dehydrogenase, partial [Muribaculaceae bacterium]|nr:D-2-hydroxyacid dehydrogenase [Muribaculaceae bacterium]